MTTPNLLPGDVVLVHKPSPISRLILGVMAAFQDDPVRFSHCLLVVQDDVCVEAGTTVRLCSLGETLGKSLRWKAMRATLGSAQDRANLARYALTHEGETYGYWRLFMQFLDHVFRTRRFTEADKLDHPICSSLIAEAYWLQFNERVNGKEWEDVDPDDFDDDVMRWTLIAEKD
jgi:hypothetical protein